MQKNQRIDPGELNAFCKDFKFSLPKSKIASIFRKVSSKQTPLDLGQFKEALPHLSLEFGLAKSKEIKNRLN